VADNAFPLHVDKPDIFPEDVKLGRRICGFWARTSGVDSEEVLFSRPEDTHCKYCT
jgi:hypothetical protein